MLWMLICRTALVQQLLDPKDSACGPVFEKNGMLQMSYSLTKSSFSKRYLESGSQRCAAHHACLLVLMTFARGSGERANFPGMKWLSYATSVNMLGGCVCCLQTDIADLTIREFGTVKQH